MLLLLFSINSVLATFDLVDFQKNACPQLYYYPLRFFVEECYTNPNVMASCPELIERYNHTYEEHEVVTPDGYILTVFRILSKVENSQPVFLQHGIASDCETFLHRGEKSLGLTLAEQNYDVWIGNARGTRYSRRHTSLGSLDYRFWDYDLDDLAINDTLPCLEKISNVTGQKVICVGHSRGSMTFLMAASEQPQLVEKLVKFGINLAPPVYMDWSPSLNQLVYVAPYIGEVLKFFRINRFFYNVDAIIKILLNVCSAFPYLCRISLDLSFGPTDQFSPNDLLVFYGAFPSTISLHELLQIAQIDSSGNFSKYDHGKEKNLVKYGQEYPPEYALGNITVPVAIFYSENDNLVTYEAANRTFNEIGSSRKIIQKVPETASVKFNHLDFIFGKDVKTLLYNDLIPSVENLLIN